MLWIILIGISVSFADKMKDKICKFQRIREVNKTQSRANDIHYKVFSTLVYLKLCT